MAQTPKRDSVSSLDRPSQSPVLCQAPFRVHLSRNAMRNRGLDGWRWGRDWRRTFSTPQDTEINSFLLALKPEDSHALSVGPVGIPTGLTTYLVSHEPATAKVNVSNGVLFDHVLVSFGQE